MTAYLESLLRDVFRAQGLKNPARAARKAAEAFDMQKRDERIYEARGSIQEIADAHGMKPSSVKNIRAREHKERKSKAHSAI